MEDTFKVRVDKIFGSLDSSSSAVSPAPSSSVRSLWCLTDDEIERKEWNRDKGSAEPEIEPDRQPNVLWIKEGPSRGIRELEKDLDDPEDDDLGEDEGEPSSLSNKPDNYNDEEWEIKSSIGRDCTLDYEEEEDEYDKVAVGREKAGDRLYMKEFNDYGIEIDSGNELPTSFRDLNRDPRANHMAAKLRLREDAEAAGKVKTLPAPEGNASSASNSSVQPPEDDANIKSILKRKDGQTDAKSQKRVRFDPQFVEKSPAKAEDTQMETEEEEEDVVRRKVALPVPSSRDFASAVPDYIRNPSRYTHYTFDSSSDVDEQSNKQAYMDFLNIVRKSKGGVEDESPAELPKTVEFVSRKKKTEPASTENVVSGEAASDRRDVSVGISVGDDDNHDGQESEACAMDEDEMESAAAADVGTGYRRRGRQYRVKAMSEEVEE